MKPWGCIPRLHSSCRGSRTSAVHPIANRPQYDSFSHNGAVARTVSIPATPTANTPVSP
ncbi:hypothetical protein NSERUTF1_7308 [Nocardia seriolae]|nr:hypothetical protein NSERUTF1_7308 [Nocardia seriolae]